MRLARPCIKKETLRQKSLNVSTIGWIKKITLIFLHDFIYWVCIQPMVESAHVTTWCLHTITIYNRTSTQIQPILDLRVKKIPTLMEYPNIFAQLCIKTWQPIDNKKSAILIQKLSNWAQISPPFFSSTEPQKITHAMNLLNNITVCITNRESIQIQHVYYGIFTCNLFCCGGKPNNLRLNFCNKSTCIRTAG